MWNEILKKNKVLFSFLFKTFIVFNKFIINRYLCYIRLNVLNFQNINNISRLVITTVSLCILLFLPQIPATCRYPSCHWPDLAQQSWRGMPFEWPQPHLSCPHAANTSEWPPTKCDTSSDAESAWLASQSGEVWNQVLHGFPT